MIIDCHLYCFPQADSPAGYATLDEKMRIIQRELGGHHQPVWRARDRVPADNSTLVDPQTSELRDVSWTRHLGQLAWEYEGEVYKKQYFPPMLHNLESPPELIVAEMDYAGVDMGVFHTYPNLGPQGPLNEFLRGCVIRFPDRFMRLVSIDEASIATDPDAAIQSLSKEIEAGGRLGIQFIPGFYYKAGNEEPWDDGALRPFWQAVAAMKLPVFFTLFGGRERAFSPSWREDYIDEQRVLTRWMELYPESTVVITHGLPWMAFMEGDRIEFPEEIFEVFEAPQCHLQLLIPIQMGAMWEYPWKEAEPTVKELVERIGADRLMWGTDLPMVRRYCTYSQTLDQFRVHCEFLTEQQRGAILGGTIARVMGMGARC